MALIKCEDCEKEISDKAAACIHCGCPIATKKSDAEIETLFDNLLYNPDSESIFREFRSQSGDKHKLTINGDELIVKEFMFKPHSYKFEEITKINFGVSDNCLYVEPFRVESEIPILNGKELAICSIGLYDEDKARELYKILAERSPNAKLYDLTDYNVRAELDDEQEWNNGYDFETEGAPMTKLEKFEQKQKKIELKKAKQDLADSKNQARCPKCKSTSLSGNKKGFGLLKGAAGVAVAGPYGVVAAGIGKNKVIITCMSCGHQYKA